MPRVIGKGALAMGDAANEYYGMQQRQTKRKKKARKKRKKA